MPKGVSGECLAERYQQHIAEDHFLWEVDVHGIGGRGHEHRGAVVLDHLDMALRVAGTGGNHGAAYRRGPLPVGGHRP